jgi:hypothetical protein
MKKQKAVYLPIRVNIATPRASNPRIVAGIASPKADKPYNRKNKIKHQAERELGMFILRSPLGN